MVKSYNVEDVNGKGYEWEYAKKIDNRSTGEKISNFIYNPESNAIFGRTFKSWGALLLFYAIFYSVLAVLFAICMKVLLMTLTDEFPKWRLEESIIGTNPGLGFRPMANDTEAASVIWFSEDTKKSWIDSMMKFRDDNYNTSSIKHAIPITCTYNGQNLGMPRDPNKYCKVDLDSAIFGECSSPRNYGFGDGNSLCVFIKLNRIYGWVPDYYNTTALLPNNIPRNARENIEKTIQKNEANQVWVTCEGQSAHDQDNIGTIQYLPGPGFPYYFYPYNTPKHYMSPLVAVRFPNPKTGILINVECKAWAKNIQHKSNSQQREGSVHFEFMIDRK